MKVQTSIKTLLGWQHREINKWLNHAIPLFRGSTSHFHRYFTGQNKSCDNLISMWQGCLIYVLGRSHPHVYSNTVYKSPHFRYKYLLLFLPQVKYMHPLPTCNISHGIWFRRDYLCLSSGCGFLTWRSVKYKRNLPATPTTYLYNGKEQGNPNKYYNSEKGRV